MKMKKVSLQSATCLTLASLLMSAAAPAGAQESSETDAEGAPATAPADEAGSPDFSGSIIVTGTRIRLPNLESPVPVPSVTGNEFFATGQISVGDVLNELPALSSTFS